MVVSPDTLVLECENRSLDKYEFGYFVAPTQHFRWKATFTAKFVEEITHRTGNFKTFGVFVKMLASAFDLDSPSVNLDLLTSEDLEALRQASGLSSNSRTGGVVETTVRSKRYLIMTYQGEFDKVHYPMALSYSDMEDVGELKRTIVRLRDEVDSLRRGQVDSGSFRELENVAMNYRNEKERLAKDVAECLTENNRLVDLVDALQADNQTLRAKVERLEISLSRGRSPMHRRSPRAAQHSPASSLRAGLSRLDPSPVRRRPPTAPALRPPSLRSTGYQSPYAQSAGSQRSVKSRDSLTPKRPTTPIRSTTPKRPATPKRATTPKTTPQRGGTSMSEVDARLQALQIFCGTKNSPLKV